jgi:hypothetical protein
VSRRRTKNPQPARAADLEEIRPDHFRLRNAGLRPLIKTEGRFHGSWFDLTSWRREGMLARLHEHGFSVLTLADQVAALPALPPPAERGAPVSRAVQRNHRYSVFAVECLDWVALAPQDSPAGPLVWPQVGQVLRLRQGRGLARYALVGADRRGQAMLASLDETAALLQAYAQVQRDQPRALVLQHDGDGYFLPTLPPLPAPHRELLDRLTDQEGAGCRVDPAACPFLRDLFATLALSLHREPMAQ